VISISLKSFPLLKDDVWFNQQKMKNKNGVIVAAYKAQGLSMTGPR
jgi:hypothetical protein